MAARKERVLIVDDSEMNRIILSDMLGENYEVIEAEDGIQALVVLQRMSATIDLVLLDIVMPNMDGFAVLHEMNRNHWIEDTPVIMVSAETEPAQMERAYALGVTDFIMRPFDASVVRHRVVNTLLLYAKQKQLIGMVEQQLYEKEKNSSVMVDILSHIVEFRNGESGLHVLHVRLITEFLLRRLRQLTDTYNLTDERIALISTASALHDIGKIGIDDKILNKPGKLTDEEFAIMKTHTTIGAKMLEGLTMHNDSPLVVTAYEICRWHHERYSGRGYPDALQGDAIPISAQVVALADVYDALTSPRVYKAAFDHGTAVKMILNGECGDFNPLLLECIKENADDLRMRLEDDVVAEMNRQEMRNFADVAPSVRNDEASARTMRILDYERLKNNFFLGSADEIRFEYTLSSQVLTLSTWSAQRLDVDEVIPDPERNARMQEVIDGIQWREITRMLYETTPDNPEISLECKINCGGEPRWHRLVVRAVWTVDEPRQCEGALGKAIDIHDTRSTSDK